MYIVFVASTTMGKRFEKHEAEAMGKYIMEHAKRGQSVRVELFI